MVSGSDVHVLISSGDLRVLSYWGGVRACCDKFVPRILPIFADVCRNLQILQIYAIFFEVIFRARWAIFRILTPNLEKLDPGAVFAPRECFFRIPHVLLINLSYFSAMFEQSGLFWARFSVF